MELDQKGVEHSYIEKMFLKTYHAFNQFINLAPSLIDKDEVFFSNFWIVDVPSLKSVVDSKP